MSVLLLDIVEEVFIHLRASKPTLLAASLVCREWVNPARRQLFHDLRFRPGRRHGKFDDLYMFLLHQPFIATVVQRLTLSSGPFVFNIPGPGTPKPLTLCTLNSIINLLPSLRALAVHHVVMFSCNALPIPHHHTPPMIARRHELSRVVLDRIFVVHAAADPLCSILNATETLHELHLSPVLWARGETEQMAIPRNLPISTFSIAFSDRLPGEPNYTTRIPKHRRASKLNIFNVGDATWPCVMDLIQEDSSTLRTLTLTLNDFGSESPCVHPDL